MKAVGPNLDARADLADLWGLLQHRDGKTLAHQGEGGGQAANATACNQDGEGVLRFAHGIPFAKSRFLVLISILIKKDLIQHLCAMRAVKDLARKC
jgi:hypothetical protein